MKWKNRIWSRNGIPANLPGAMDGCDIQFGDAEREFGQKEQDRLYDSYCEYAESSRTALLRITLNPISRQMIATDQAALCRDEFFAALAAMSCAQRRAFIRRVICGYELA